MNAVEWDSSSQRKTPSLSNFHLTFTTSLLLHSQETNEWQWKKHHEWRCIWKFLLEMVIFQPAILDLFVLCVCVRGNWRKIINKLMEPFKFKPYNFPSSETLQSFYCTTLVVVGGGCCIIRIDTSRQGKQNSERTYEFIYIKVKRLYWRNLPILSLTGFQVAIKRLKRKSSMSVGKISDDDFSQWLLPRFLRRWMVDAIHFRSSLALSCFSWCCWKHRRFCCLLLSLGGLGGKT